ncbi:MAG: hypothetical protein DYH05_01920 [Acidobacteria bacterium ACB1]|nr:hypothetical protein [Acidobacteria bacterium ACB1]
MFPADKKCGSAAIAQTHWSSAERRLAVAIYDYRTARRTRGLKYLTIFRCQVAKYDLSVLVNKDHLADRTVFFDPPKKLGDPFLAAAGILDLFCRLLVKGHTRLHRLLPPAHGWLHLEISRDEERHEENKGHRDEEPEKDLYEKLHTTV